jgi:dienelactone hydrolase
MTISFRYLLAATGLGLATLLSLSPATARAGEEVTYSANGTTLKGYLARPAGTTTSAAGAKRPGVLVVHEWWGNNDYPRKRADMLAELGYVALSLDMYGDGKVAEHPKDAGAFAGAVRKDMATAEKRFLAARALLSRQPDVDTGRIAAIGYCFGGGIVLEMARRGVPLNAVVSFHGSLAPVTPMPPGAFKGKVLVLNGAADPLVKPDQIAAFKQEMEAARADWRFIDYPGALHGFTNPAATEKGKQFNSPLAYDADADRKSWEEMKALLANVFR